MNLKVNNKQNFLGINKKMTDNNSIKNFAINFAKITFNKAKEEINQYGYHEPFALSCELPTGKVVKFAIEYAPCRKNEPDNIKSFTIAFQKNDDSINKNILKTGTMEEIEKFIKENENAIYNSINGLLS